MSRYKDLNDEQFVDLDFFDDKVQEKLGFTVVCNNCGQRKTIVYSPGELFDFNNDIDVRADEIYCAGCYNTLKEGE